MEEHVNILMYRRLHQLANPLDAFAKISRIAFNLHGFNSADIQPDELIFQ